MDTEIAKKILCELCAWKFDDQILYEIHMSLVHEQRDEFDHDIQFNLYKYMKKIVYGESSQEMDPIFDSEDDSSNQIPPLCKDKKIFQCSFCDAKFAENGSLKRHVITFHEGSFICKICNTDFVNKSNLNCHNALVHENRDLFQCSYCDAIFNDKGSWKRHVEGKDSIITRNYPLRGYFLGVLAHITAWA